MTPCPRCNGTGNAHETAILNDGDEYSGCLQCGGTGVLDWRNDLFRVIAFVSFLGFMIWLLAQ